MPALVVKRTPVGGTDNPAYPISKNVWNEPLSYTGEVPVANGGTGAPDAPGARIALGVSADTRTVNAQTGTSYTLVLADKSAVIVRDNASANTITVPTNATVAFPIGSQIDLLQHGTGQTTIVAAVGVTIHSVGGNLKISGQFAAAALLKRATDEWWLFGDLTT